MNKGMLSVRKLLYVKTIIITFIRSFCYYVVLVCRNLFRRFLSFIKAHKQTSIKLAIPLIIIGLVYHACSATKRLIKHNLYEIFAISDEIRTYYADKPDYWGLCAEKIVKEHILPNKFLRDGKIILNSGTEIFIGNGASAEVVMPFSQTFDIILKNLNKAQCISYAEMPLSDDNLIKLYSIHIVNKAGEFVFEWGGNKPLPISRYATKDLCTDDENTVIWSIK